MDSKEIGWTADLPAEVRGTTMEPGQSVARVSAEHRGAWEVWTATGTRRATLAGSLRHQGASAAVGDWVVIEASDDGEARIAALLPRRSALARRASPATRRAPPPPTKRASIPRSRRRARATT